MHFWHGKLTSMHCVVIFFLSVGGPLERERQPQGCPQNKGSRIGQSQANGGQTKAALLRIKLVLFFFSFTTEISLQRVSSCFLKPAQIFDKRKKKYRHSFIISFFNLLIVRASYATQGKERHVYWRWVLGRVALKMVWRAFEGARMTRWGRGNLILEFWFAQ